MVSLALSMLRTSHYWEATSKIGGRGWTEARNVIDTQEHAAISKVAKPAITSIAFSNLPLAADSLIRSH
jgi:hypothetical protein